jgi:hypothetical protein
LRAETAQDAATTLAKRLVTSLYVTVVVVVLTATAIQVASKTSVDTAPDRH